MPTAHDWFQPVSSTCTCIHSETNTLLLVKVEGLVSSFSAHTDSGDQFYLQVYRLSRSCAAESYTKCTDNLHLFTANLCIITADILYF